LASDLRAAIEETKFLEADLIKANCVKRRYIGEKWRLKTDLRDNPPKGTGPRKWNELLLLLLLLLLTANGFSPGGSGTTIRQQTKYKLTTIRQHTI
jgi:hypothetical protein